MSMLKIRTILYNRRVAPAAHEGISKKDSSRVTGTTRSNKTVNIVGGIDLTGKLVPVRIKEVHLHSLSGELEELSKRER